MVTIVVLLGIFLVIGLFSRKFNTWTRLLLIAIIAGTLVYLYL